MSKILLVALFLGLSFSGYSIRKKKQLELLQSINIVYEGKGVLAGNSLNSYLQFVLSDGRKLYSNKRSRLGFRDFKISVKGSGRSTWVGKRRMQVRSNYNALHDPYIHLGFELIDNPEIALDVSIPIHFNGHFSLNYSASNASSGGNRGSGRAGNDGRCNYANGNGEDGRSGQRGNDGFDGRDGFDADDLDVYVSMVDFHRDNTQLVKIEGCFRGGKCWTRYVTQDGSIKIYNRGGNGGVGGNGGRGGRGGNGGNGLKDRSDNDDDRSCRTAGWGGHGGNGGAGGRGGNGGNGGDGGDIYVYFTKDAEFFKNQMYFYTEGGEGGRGGLPGKGGTSGLGGTGGKGCGNNGNRGAKGYPGRSGYRGRSGQVFFEVWE